MSDKKTPCEGLTDLFYSDDDGQQATAKRICETCPFKDACLEKGMNEQYGTWGGATEKERRKIQKANRN